MEFRSARTLLLPADPKHDLDGDPSRGHFEVTWKETLQAVQHQLNCISPLRQEALVLWYEC